MDAPETKCLDFSGALFLGVPTDELELRKIRELDQRLALLQIKTLTFYHSPARDAEDHAGHSSHVPGRPIKTLLVRDADDTVYMLACLQSTRWSLPQLAARLSLKAPLKEEPPTLLGTCSTSLSPFSLTLDARPGGTLLADARRPKKLVQSLFLGRALCQQDVVCLWDSSP
jgi:hypothetical protein